MSVSHPNQEKDGNVNVDQIIDNSHVVRNTSTRTNDDDDFNDVNIDNFCIRLSRTTYVVDPDDDCDTDLNSSDCNDDDLTLEDSSDENEYTTDDSKSGSDSDTESEMNGNLNSPNQRNSLSCLALNVGGVQNKLLHPEFHNLITKYDIICLSETHLSDIEEVKIAGFTSFYKNRQKYKKKSGGLLVLIKDTWTQYVTLYENVNYKTKIADDAKNYYTFVNHDISNQTMIFKVSNPERNIDTLFCSVYIEPSTSKYFNNNVYVDIQNTLGYFHYDHVCLLGDFNSRTGLQNELLDENAYVDKLSDLESLTEIPRRKSQDQLTNNMGIELIDLCRTNGYVIVNGRLGNDAGIGKTTCKNVSVVDYAIVSYDLLPNVMDFSVIDFDELFSDVHNPIEINFSLQSSDRVPLNHRKKENNLCTNDETFIRWDKSKKNDFTRSLDNDKIKNLETRLDNMLANSSAISKDNINEVIAEVKDILLNSARSLGMVKNRKKKKLSGNTIKRNFDKPWFDYSCKIKRKQYSRARHRLKKNKENTQLKEYVKQLAKDYKRHVRKKDREYKHNIASKLRNLKTNDTKAFHDILNNKSNEPSDMPTAEEFLEMFKNLNENPDNSEPEINNNLQNDNNILNTEITQGEILKAIKRLKNNKAYCSDKIPNEFLKYSSEKLINIFSKLFNLILNTGLIPTDWSIGIIKPIYKKKGSSNDPNNYRGITILSCFGKLFTSILNERIKTFLEINKLLGHEQTGFRNGFSTLDHLFTLYGIIDVLLAKRKRLYCAFLDLEKAFDKINRTLLWEKLIRTGVEGKILNVIINLYLDAKSCVQVKVDNISNCSEFFSSKVGVRQGENLSPLLFAIYLNDIKGYIQVNMNGIPTVAETVRDMNLTESEVNTLINLFILLYADDSVIFSESAKDLQKGLDLFKTYCDRFKLVLNARKCKVVIFSRGEIRNKPHFNIGSEEIEIVSEFTYLGLKLNYNNRLKVAQKDLYCRASRAMFSLLKKSQANNLPLDLMIDLFDSMVLPVLLYGCEIWGFETIDCMNKLQLKFYKYILRLRQSTPSMMIYSELGKFPILISIKCRLLCFWLKLVNGPASERLSSLTYKCLLNLYENNTHKNNYLSFVKKTLDELGLSNFWTNQMQINVNPMWFKAKVNRLLQDQFIQSFYSSLDNDPIYTNFRMFKTNFRRESAIFQLPKNYVISQIRFRTTNNNAPVNILRFTQTPRADRLCQKCNINDIGDEFHYLFVCSHFQTQREQYIPKYFYNRPNSIKFEQISNSKDSKILLQLSKFISYIDRELKT